MQSPTILIPGIQGTKLINVNSLHFDTIWSAVQSRYENIFDLELTPDTRFDVSPGVLIERGDVEDLAYRESVIILEHKIRSPVFIFGYDWRKSCAENGKRLKALVDYLREKLCTRRFNFLTHSMGGMVFSCYLRELGGDYDVIEHAVLTVCPFLGAVDALIGLIVGEGGSKFPLFNSNDEFRKIARSFPSVYELCPVYPDAVSFAAGEDFDLFDPDHWQSNISNFPIFRERIAGLKSFRQPQAPAMFPLSLLPRQVKERFLILAAEGEQTNIKAVVYPKDPAGRVSNYFDFCRDKGEGDGTVPLVSATAFKEEVLTLVVESKWYDKATHSLFLNDGRVQSVISRFLKCDTAYPRWWSDIGCTVRKA